MLKIFDDFGVILKCIRSKTLQILFKDCNAYLVLLLLSWLCCNLNEISRKMYRNGIKNDKFFKTFGYLGSLWGTLKQKQTPQLYSHRVRHLQPKFPLLLSYRFCFCDAEQEFFALFLIYGGHWRLHSCRGFCPVRYFLGLTSREHQNFQHKDFTSKNLQTLFAVQTVSNNFIERLP